MQELYPDMFNTVNDNRFNEIALEVYNIQRSNCRVYDTYCSQLKPQLTPKNYREIPFLPISFFKTHEVISKNHKPQTVFYSSGTTGIERSRHMVADLHLYQDSFLKSFQWFYGNPKDFCFIALLPSYLDNKNSSLLYMINHFLSVSIYTESGYYLSHKGDLPNILKTLNENKTPTILFGVTYALLDFAEECPMNLSNIFIMETGGVKGRRKEMTKQEVHEILNNAFHTKAIHSEYGMTELLSQAYSKGNNVFSCPPWMKILTRDTQDPLSWEKSQKTGGINVIDLANIHSCSFIETQDLGKVFDNGDFEILGRFDNSDIRGCNLLTEL